MENQLQLTDSEKSDLASIVLGETEKQLFEFEELQQKLFHHFKTSMPYGVAKADDGDPDEWIIDNLESLMQQGFSLEKALVKLGEDNNG